MKMLSHYEKCYTNGQRFKSRKLPNTEDTAQCSDPR